VAKTVEDVKCNMDAEMFPQQHGFGIGLCICNDKGEFLKSKTYTGIMFFYQRKQKLWD
jgi:hypothetical protein